MFTLQYLVIFTLSADVVLLGKKWHGIVRSGNKWPDQHVDGVMLTCARGKKWRDDMKSGKTTCDWGNIAEKWHNR